MTAAGRYTLAAYVRDLLYEDKGREIRGSRHFAPGTLVYVGPPYSGDGWERTYISGPHRDTGRVVSVLGPRSRLVHHHKHLVTDPGALRELERKGILWDLSSESRSSLLSAFPEDPLADTREAGWAPGEWERLTSRLLCPARPRLAECVAVVLGVFLGTAQEELRRGTAGRTLRELMRGRPSPGRSPLRGTREAWKALAPVPWLESSERRFLTRDDEEREVPDSAHAAACLCADVEGVMAAEALARELAALCGVTGPVRIVWRAVARTDVYERVALPWSMAGPLPAVTLETLSQVLAASAPCIFDNEVSWRRYAEAALDAHGLSREALRPLFGLLQLGYAVERLEPGRVVLFCPLLPTLHR